MWEALAGLLAIAGLLLRHWLAPRSEEEKRAEDKAEFDRALAAGDHDALSRLFDELRQAGAPGPRDPGGPDDQEFAERQL